MKRKTITILLSLFLILMAAGAALIPFLYLRGRAHRKNNRVGEVPASYYAKRTSAYSENASRQLTDPERLQLIYGLWESTAEAIPADSEELSLTPFDAAQQAREYINHLYSCGAYPVSVGSEAEAWYAWNAEPYRVRDTAFRTFTVSYWLVTFTRYDTSEYHTVCLMDSGTFCFAYSQGTPLKALPEDSVYSSTSTISSSTQTVSTVTDPVEIYLSLFAVWQNPQGLSGGRTSIYSADTSWEEVSPEEVPAIPRFQELWAGEPADSAETGRRGIVISGSNISFSEDLDINTLMQTSYSMGADCFQLWVRNSPSTPGRNGSALILLAPYQPPEE